MIEFEDAEAAERAVEVYDEGWFGGVIIHVERAIHKNHIEKQGISLKRQSVDDISTQSASKRMR